MPVTSNYPGFFFYSAFFFLHSYSFSPTYLIHILKRTKLAGGEKKWTRMPRIFAGGSHASRALSVALATALLMRQKGGRCASYILVAVFNLNTIILAPIRRVPGPTS